MSLNRFDEGNPNVITKESDHPLSALLLGEVVGAYLLGPAIILYYADKHQIAVGVDIDGDINISEHKVPSC